MNGGPDKQQPWNYEKLLSLLDDPAAYDAIARQIFHRQGVPVEDWDAPGLPWLSWLDDLTSWMRPDKPRRMTRMTKLFGKDPKIVAGQPGSHSDYNIANAIAEHAASEDLDYDDYWLMTKRMFPQDTSLANRLYRDDLGAERKRSEGMHQHAYNLLALPYAQPQNASPELMEYASEKATGRGYGDLHEVLVELARLRQAMQEEEPGHPKISERATKAIYRR